MFHVPRPKFQKNLTPSNFHTCFCPLSYEGFCTWRTTWRGRRGRRGRVAPTLQRKSKYDDNLSSLASNGKKGGSARLIFPFLWIIFCPDHSEAAAALASTGLNQPRETSARGQHQGNDQCWLVPALTEQRLLGHRFIPELDPERMLHAKLVHIV